MGNRSPQKLGGNRYDQCSDEQQKHLGERTLPLALVGVGVAAGALVRLHASCRGRSDPRSDHSSFAPTKALLGYSPRSRSKSASTLSISF
jgi:hypothetical protein